MAASPVETLAISDWLNAASSGIDFLVNSAKGFLGPRLVGLLGWLPSWPLQAETVPNQVSADWELDGARVKATRAPAILKPMDMAKIGAIGAARVYHEAGQTRRYSVAQECAGRLDAVKGAYRPRSEVLPVHHGISGHLSAVADAKENSEEIKGPGIAGPKEEHDGQALESTSRWP